MKSRNWKYIFFVNLTLLFSYLSCENTLPYSGHISTTENQSITSENIKDIFSKIFPTGLLYTKVPRGLIVSVDSSILFTNNNSEIRPEAENFLYNLGEIIKTLDKECVIEGNSQIGSNSKDNLELSIIRAENIAKFLIKHNKINPQKIRAIGFGDMMPFSDNVSYKGSLDRRIDFVILNY